MKKIYTLVLLFIQCSLFAQTWQAEYIGGKHDKMTSFSFENDTLKIVGTGLDWWNAQDDAYFVYQELCGDVTLTARLDSQEITSEWAKAGLIVRKDLTAGAATSILVNTDAAGLLHQYRPQQDVEMLSIEDNAGKRAPIWLRVQKEANIVKFFYSENGEDWQAYGEQSMDLNNTFFIGFGVSSINDTTSTAVFSNINLEQQVTQNFTFTESENLSLNEPYSVIESIDASGGKFVQVSEQSQAETPTSGIKIDLASCNSGQHILWGRFRNTDKAWVKLQNEWQLWEVESSLDWEWKPLKIDDEVQNIDITNLSQIELAYFENFEFDRLLLTDSLTFVPKGFDFFEKLQGTFYIAANGNDNNDGKSPEQAWKTLEAVNEQMKGALPSTEILFRKGDTFRGSLEIKQSGTANSPIKLGSYGSNEVKPIISGAVLAQNWEVHQGNIYKTTLDVEKVEMLFFDGELLTLARFPNNSLLFSTRSEETTGFFSEQLTQEDGYWDGATVRFHPRNWTWEHREIKSYQAGNIEYTNPAFYDFLPNWGFYIDNKLEELDQEGEWFFDSYNKVLYLWSPSDQNPNEHIVEASIFENGVLLQSVSHISIEDLHFTQFANSGILAEAGNNIAIQNNEFTQNWNTGIEFSTNEISIKGNYLHDLVSRGIVGYNTSQAVISDNLLKRNAMINGYGFSSGFQHNTSIFLLNAANSSITYNQLDSIGGMGIAYYGNDGLISYNALSNILLRIDDGGGLYAWGDYSQNTTWDYNYVENVIGSHQGAEGEQNHTRGTIAVGVYMDNQTNNNLISNNTIAENYIGMISNWNTQNNKFVGNTTYKNTIGELMLNNLNEGVIGLETKNNIFYSDNNRVTPLVINGINRNDINAVSSFEDNLYLSPYLKENIIVTGVPLSEWKEKAQEPNAKLSFFTLEENEMDPSELLVNTTKEIKEITLEGDYFDVEGKAISTFQLQPFESKIVFKNQELERRILEEIPLSTNSLLSSHIRIYPNPSQDWLRIENSPPNSRVRIISTNGALLVDKKLNGQEIQVSSLPSGLYQLQLIHQESSYIFKILKQ